MKIPKKMSRWVINIILSMVICTVYIGYNSVRHAENYIDTASDLKFNLLMTKAESIYPTKEYMDITIVDKEKEIFAVHNYGETSKIVDKDGNILVDTGITEPLYRADYLDSNGFNYESYVTDKKSLKATDDSGTTIIDVESLNMIKTDYEDVNVHNSGKYFVGKTHDSNYVLQTLEGDVLKASDEPMWLTTDESYIICYLGNDWETSNAAQAGDYGLFNLSTGKMEYTSKYKEVIVDRVMGYTMAQRSQYVFEYVIMDEKYNDVLDRQSFWSITVYDTYIGTTALDGCYSGKTTYSRENRDEIMIPRIYDKELNCIFEGSKGTEFLLLEEDMIITSSTGEGRNKHDYARLPKGGAVDE